MEKIDIFSAESRALLYEHLDEFIAFESGLIQHLTCTWDYQSRTLSPWGMRGAVIGHLKRWHSL